MSTQVGQHYFKDLATGSDMTFVTGNLLPITPMYYPPDDLDAKLNAFLFSWPGCQHGDGPAWDNVPAFCGLTNALMCQNFCNEDCSLSHFVPYTWHSPTIERYGTYHIFFFEDDDWDSLSCPGAPPHIGHGFRYVGGRTCPANTATPEMYPPETSSVRRIV